MGGGALKFLGKVLLLEIFGGFTLLLNTGDLPGAGGGILGGVGGEGLDGANFLINYMHFFLFLLYLHDNPLPVSTAAPLVFLSVGIP